MKTIKTSEDLLKSLCKIESELDSMCSLDGVCVSSGLYAFLYACKFHVKSAMTHLDEFVEE